MRTTWNGVVPGLPFRCPWSVGQSLCLMDHRWGKLFVVLPWAHGVESFEVTRTEALCSCCLIISGERGPPHVPLRRYRASSCPSGHSWSKWGVGVQIRKRRVRVPAFLLLKFLSQTEGSRIARTSRELNCFLAPWPRREISVASMNVSTRVKPHHRTRIKNSDFILVTVEIWACRIYPLWRMFRSRILRECLLLVT